MNNNILRKKMLFSCLLLSTSLLTSGCDVINTNLYRYVNNKNYKSYGDYKNEKIANDNSEKGLKYIVIIENNNAVIIETSYHSYQFEFKIGESVVKITDNCNYYVFKDKDLAFEFANGLISDDGKITFFDNSEKSISNNTISSNTLKLSR